MGIVKSVLGLSLLAGIAFTPLVRAQTAAAPVAGPAVALAPPTIAMVDMQRVLFESAAGKTIQTQLETEGRKVRDQVTKLQDDLKNGENDLKRQRSVLQPDAFNDQVQVFQRKEAEAQRIVQERKEALSKGENDAVNVVIDNMREVVQQLAAERRITLVLRKEVTITVIDKNMDITDDVIQRLNTKLPAVTVTIAAPGVASAPASAGGTPAAQAPSQTATKPSKK